MKVNAIQSALCFVVLLMPGLAVAEDARLPYQDLWRIQKTQIELGRVHTNLALVLQICSTNPAVKSTDISAYVDSKSGRVPIPIGPEGAFTVPARDDLLAENPWIIVNQPRGTMQLNWHAGLAPSVAQSMTNAIHYGPLMRIVRQSDDVQEAMRQCFPNAPRLTAVGLRLTFRASAIGPAAIIHARDGNRRLPANALGELLIPIDGDLMDQDPIVTLTDNPAAVEIVLRKADAPP